MSVLQKLNLLQYKIVNAGLIFTGGTVQKYELDMTEEKCYKECVAEVYYDILQEIVSEKFKYDMVIEHFSICLKDLSFENAVLFDTIETTADYANHTQTINEIFAKTLKSNAEKILKNKKIIS